MSGNRMTNPLTPEQQGAEPGKLEDWQCLHCIAGAHTLCVDDGICRCSCRSVSTPGPVTNLGGTVTHKPTKPQAPIDSEGAKTITIYDNAPGAGGEPGDPAHGWKSTSGSEGAGEVELRKIIQGYQPKSHFWTQMEEDYFQQHTVPWLTRQSAQAAERAVREELEGLLDITYTTKDEDGDDHEVVRVESVERRLKALTDKEVE